MENRQSTGQSQNQGGEGRRYVVQNGDTLISIAEKVYGNAKAFTDIYQANQDVILDPEHLVPGTELYIPPSAEQIHREYHANAPADTAAGQANERERQRRQSGQ